MNDKIIIRKFLDLNFNLDINGFRIMIYDKFNRKFINENSFKKILFVVFDDVIELELVAEWYKEKKDHMTRDVITYLNDLELEFDSIGWTMRKDGRNIKLEDILQHFCSKYDNFFLQNFIYGFLEEKRIQIELTKEQKKLIKRFGKLFNE